MTGVGSPSSLFPGAVNLAAFQQQLAARVHSAQAGAGPAPAAWLAVLVRGHDCLLPLAQCGALHPWRVPEPVPHSPFWMEGIVALQGTLYAVANLGAVLDPSGLAHGNVAHRPAGLLTLASRWGMPLAWRVDHIVGLRGAKDFGASRPPSPTAAPHWQMAHRDAQGRWWSLLDLQALVRSEAFRSVGMGMSLRG